MFGRFVAIPSENHGLVCPADPFPILEPHNLSIKEFMYFQERRTMDFKSRKSWKG